MIKRIIDKQTNLFIRDDFDFKEETEIALDVEPAQGFYHPKWNGEEWEEGLTEDEIQAIKDSVLPTEPTLEEKAAEHDTKIVTLEETVDVLFGGVING